MEVLMHNRLQTAAGIQRNPCSVNFRYLCYLSLISLIAQLLVTYFSDLRPPRPLWLFRAYEIQDIPPGVQDQPGQAVLTSRVGEARVLDGNYRGSQESSCITHVLTGSPETGKPKRLIEFSCSEMLIQTAFSWVFPTLWKATLRKQGSLWTAAPFRHVSPALTLQKRWRYIIRSKHSGNLILSSS